MRKDLKQFLGLKVNAIAKFEKYGLVYNDSATRYIKDKRSYRILLKNIIIEHKGEKYYIGHQWFKITNTFKNLGILKTGDKLKLYGVVQKYTKNKGKEEDYETHCLRIERR
ncbi:hypothetical protein IC214_00150 [Clostridioides sp. ES-S-0190-01]|nr:hypothetical protein [Clostridioides sp. ES-S-0145-01]MCC0682291.1 hypothetical protein [Clostridioides sp. ES-S-0005-03]MCC0705448.1 hypothetical protein [Clostridioides sp. ES-S-0190-01]UDN64190.1 hypothetical protein IC758_20340 [Clostridioides sp. ES-W-0016-02]